MIGYWKFEKPDPTGPDVPWGERSLDMGNLSLKFFGAGTKVSLCRLSSKSQRGSERIERGTDLFKIRQKILPIPPWISEFLPRIVVA